jgi:hypothetical protein
MSFVLEETDPSGVLYAVLAPLFAVIEKRRKEGVLFAFGPSETPEFCQPVLANCRLWIIFANTPM